MIESIEFTNFKALRETHLQLSPFTLLLGPNGSGKSSVLQALQGIAIAAAQPLQSIGADAVRAGNPWIGARSVMVTDKEAAVVIKLRLRWEGNLLIATFQWDLKRGQVLRKFVYENGTAVQSDAVSALLLWLARMQTFALDASAIAQPHPVQSEPLQSNGTGLAAVLDGLKDNYPERWTLLLAEMCEWLPEYSNIMFDKPQQGQKGIVLRTKKGDHRIPANALSQGTLVGLALLTLAYVPSPPSLVALEEIDRGLHPRLLRHLRDALYRLSYPDSCGEKRPPVQVIATSHSPYLLDLYRDHPEEVVLAQKKGLEVKMDRLKDIGHFEEILGDAPLSEVWYSGVLGGVTVKP